MSKECPYKVYLAVVVERPLPQEARDLGVLPKVIFGPAPIVAHDEEDAAVQAGVAAAAMHSGDATRLEAKIMLMH